jgi:hypothetical protein
VASVRGASHRRSGAPNQDFGRTLTLPGGAGVVLAVADGHGDVLHARSDRGARFAVEAGLRTVGDWLAAAGERPETALQRAAAALPARLLAAWRSAVADDLRADPIPPGGLPGIDPADLAEVRRAPELLYGSTLLVAGLGPRCDLFLQIGDGDMLQVDAEGQPRRLVPGRTDLPPHVTESLCEPQADRRFRRALSFHAAAAIPPLILLATDGYAKSYADDSAFLKVGADLKRYLEESGAAEIEAALPGWLDETSRTGSGDDITAALLWRPAAAVLPRRRRSTGLPLLAGIAALALAGSLLAAFWPFHPAGPGPQPVPAAVPLHPGAR